MHIYISTYLHIYLFTYLLSVKTASVAGRWSAPIFLSAAALLRTECDHVPPPLAVLHTPNMGPVSSWEYVCVDKWRDVAATELCATMDI